MSVEELIEKVFRYVQSNFGMDDEYLSIANYTVAICLRENPNNLEAYTIRSVRNACLLYKQNLHMSIEPEEIKNSNISEYKEILPKEYVVYFECLHEQNMTRSEISKKLNIPYSTVCYKITRMYIWLKQWLDRQ